MIYYTLNWIIYIVKDWAERVWVKSERLIGEKKDMIVYSLLLEDVISLNKISDISLILVKEDIFTMILNSKASKHIDRFYAILPHTKYAHHIKDVTTWEINNMTNVVLKLLEICDLKDKILFLINRKNYSDFSFDSSFLPSFATYPKGYNCLLGMNYIQLTCDYEKIYIDNIILKNNYLHLKTTYYKIETEYILDDINSNLYKVGLTTNDKIVLLNIPLAKINNLLPVYSIIIKGNMEKNIWVALDIVLNDFVTEQKEMKTFRIY